MTQPDPLSPEAVERRVSIEERWPSIDQAFDRDVDAVMVLKSDLAEMCTALTEAEGEATELEAALARTAGNRDDLAQDLDEADDIKKLAWRIIFGDKCIKTPQRAVIVCRAIEFAKEVAPHLLPATPLRDLIENETIP